MATEEHKQAMGEYRDLAQTKTEIIRVNGARCIVCTTQIPPERERRGSVTCSNSCKEALRTRRLDNLRQQKCPHCYHPSTPKEWESFRRWRLAEGGKLTDARPISVSRGNPQWRAKAIRFAKALDKVEKWLTGNIVSIPEGVSVGNMHQAFLTVLQEVTDTGFAKVLLDAKKTLDAEPVE